MSKKQRFYLDEVMSTDEAAEYLGVSRWWLQRRLSPYIAENNAPEPIAKLGYMELWTKEQLDSLGPLPTLEWPEYATGEMSEGYDWHKISGYAYNPWAPTHGMTACGPDEARKNAEAWLFVADNWSVLTFQGVSSKP